MFLVPVLRNALFVLVPLSVILSSYLYLYPIFNQSCAFPTPEQDASTSYHDTLRQHNPFDSNVPHKLAPFRLLSLGDPQLEGESSIPDPDAANFPNFARFWEDALLLNGMRHTPLQRLRHSLHDLIDFYLDDIPKALNIYRKRLDHIGNDYYLGHIYRTLHWWTLPTHVTVLGDLVGSQWIDDEEFESRGWRFWNRVFNGGLKVPDEVASSPAYDFNNTITLGTEAAAWKKRIMNVAGNHDIGYAGDISVSRIERFTKTFGKPNYELRFVLPVNTTSPALQVGANGIVGQEKTTPELRIVVLNDMNLDTPAGSKEAQDETYRFLNDVISTSRDVAQSAHFTILLTHIPMYKNTGVCVDGPFFDFFGDNFSNGVKEQNHLSRDASKGILEGIFGMSANPQTPGWGFGRNGLVLTGHDHEGCDVYHYVNQTEFPDSQWEAKSWVDAVNLNVTEAPGFPGLREITVRSMMGDFAGNAGLLSLWFDEEDWDWRFEFQNCRFGTQHLWWIVHILDLITVGVGIVYALLKSIQKLQQALSAKSTLKYSPNHNISRSVSVSRAREDYLAKEVGVSLNGNLDVPGVGKRSVRKKKSRLNLKVPNGTSPSGSTVSR